MTALKTISARIRGSKTELAELGEDTQELAEGFSKYAKEIKALTGFDIVVEGTTDQFKDLYDIMEGISGVWDKLSDTQRARVAEILGGTRQFQVISSIIGNWKDSVGAYETAMESAGAATEANNTYMESAQAHINQFKVAFSDLAMKVVDSGLVADVADFGTGLLNILSKAGKLISVLSDIVKWLGGINGLLMITATYFAITKMGAISSFLSSIPTTLAGVVAWIAGVNSGLEITGTLLTFIEAHPVLAAVAAVAAVATVLHTVSSLTNNLENDVEELRGLKDDFSQTQSEISGVTEELESVRDRINEINSLDNPSFTDKEELEKLVAQNDELERELDLLKQRRDELNASKGSKFVDVMEKDYDVNNNDPTEKKLRKYRSKNYKPESYDEISLYNNRPDLNEKGLINSVILRRYEILELLSKDIGEKQKKNLEKELKEINELLTTEYDSMTEVANGVEYIKVPGTEEEKAVNEWLDFIEDFKDRYAIAMGGEHAKTNAFNRLVDNWQFDEALQEMQDLGEQGKVTGESLQKMYEDANNNSEFKAFVDKLFELGVISKNDKDNFNLLALAFNTCGKSLSSVSDSAEEATQDVKSFKDVLSEVQSLSSGLNELSKIYKDIADGGDFDFSSILNNQAFNEAFGKLGESYDNFIKTIANSPSDIKACQSAFNDLLSEYLANSKALDDVTEAERDATVAMLEQMGVANAAEVVDARLEYNKKKLEIATDDLADAEYASVYAAYAAAESGSLEEQALAELAIEKFKLNNTKIDTSDDIDQLIALANSAYATEESIRNLTKAKDLMSRAEDLNVQIASLDSATDFWKISELTIEYHKLIDEANNLASKPIKYKIDPADFYPDISGITNATKVTEEYTAEINELYDAEQRLESVKQRISDIDHELSMTDDIGEQIELKKQLISLYEEEIAAIKNVNNERDKQISSNVEKLRNKGFVVDYDPSTDYLYIHNQELINSLKGKDKEATNELIKEYEKLIDETISLNNENIQSQDEWRDLEESIRSTTEEIRKMAYDDDIKDMKFNIEVVERNGASKEQLVSEWRSVAQRIESEIAYYRSKGYDDTSDVIQDLIHDLWDVEDEIKNITEDLERMRKEAFDDELNDMKFYVEIVERNGASKEQLVAEWSNVARRIEAEIAYYRSIGYNETSDVLQDLIRDLWNVQDEIKRINDEIAEDLRRKQEEAEEARKKAEEEAAEARRKAEEEAKQGLEKIVELTKDLIKWETQNQIKALEDQVDEYQKIIDKKKEAIRLAKDERKYEEDIADKVKDISKLQARIDKLSLDDSREAQIERQKLIEELADKQKDLADYQRDYAEDATMDALDKEYQRYSDTKQKEIDLLNETISSEEKLYQAAVERINNSWDSLYQDLIRYNTEAGNTINSEITENWNKAIKAVKEYGYAVTEAGIIGGGGGSNSSNSSNSSSDSYSPPSPRDSGWVLVRDPNDTSHGWWWAQEPIPAYMERAPEYVYKLYGYHTGGIAGDLKTLKDNEVLSVLEKGEVILDDKKKKSLYKTIDFVSYLSDKLGSIIDESKLFDISSVSPGSSVLNARPNTNIKDISVSNESSMVFSPNVSVNINGTGLDDPAAAKSIGEKIANITIDKLHAAMEMKGIKNLRSPGLKAY